MQFVGKFRSCSLSLLEVYRRLSTMERLTYQDTELSSRPSEAQEWLQAEPFPGIRAANPRQKHILLLQCGAVPFGRQAARQLPPKTVSGICHHV